jgi:hypothetical protein
VILVKTREISKLRSRVPDRCCNYGSDRPLNPTPKHGGFVIRSISDVCQVLMVSTLHRHSKDWRLGNTL